MSNLYRLGLLSALVLLYLGVDVFDHELWAPTEQAVAGVTWEMYRSDELFIPAIDGLPYLEKPPLAYLLSWAAFKLGGHASPGLLRLPAAIAGLISILLVLWSARRLYGEAIGWLCAFLCALTLTFYTIMHRASTDSIAIAFCFLCFALFLRTLEPAESAAPQLKTRTIGPTDVAFCVVLAVSFFVKNFYTYLIVVPPVAMYLLLRREYRRLATMGLLNAVVLTALLIPWCYTLYTHGGTEYLRIVFFDNTLGRFTRIGPPAGAVLTMLDDAFRVHKQATPWIAVPAFLEQMMPWIAIEAAAIWSLSRQPEGRPSRLFLLIACASIPLCLVSSASRVDTYFRPLVFVLTMLAGDWLQSTYANAPTTRVSRKLIAANIWGAALLLAAAPLAIGRYLGAPEIGWLSLPATVGLGGLALASRGRWLGPETPLRWTGFAAVVFAATLAVAIPRLNEQLSWRPFFDEIKPSVAADTELWTTAVDDRHLPAMNFYLNRRVRLAQRKEDVVALLEEQRPVGVIVPIADYEALRSELTPVAHEVVRARKGRDLFVYLSNGRPDRARGRMVSQLDRTSGSRACYAESATTATDCEAVSARSGAAASQPRAASRVRRPRRRP